MTHVAYILDLFPVTSETFIVREIHELIRQGAQVDIFPLRDATGGIYSQVIHDDTKRLLGKVHHFASLRSRFQKLRLLQRHLSCLATGPKGYLEAFSIARKKGGSTWGMFKRAPIYAGFFKKAGITHIHAHFSLEACKLAMLCSLVSGIPYSFTMHAHDIFIPEKHDLIDEKFGHAKFVASISDFNKRFICTRYPGIDPDKIHIVHCGIDLDKFPPASASKNETVQVLAVGRLAGQKGFIHLVAACGLLKEKGLLNFKCKIIGEGQERERLEAAILNQDLSDAIELLGAREQAQVAAHMDAADIFVLPCVPETNGSMDGIPVALMEAMAKGIPVVSTTLSGIPELINESAGRLVPAENAEALAEALSEIAGLSPERRMKMGAAGRAIVEKQFNIRTEIKKLAGLIGRHP